MLAKLLAIRSTVRSRLNWLGAALLKAFRQTSSFVRSLPIRLRIVLLKMIQGIVSSRLFRWVLAPPLYVALIVYGFTLAFGRTPRNPLPPDSPRSQELSDMIVQLAASRRAPVQRGPVSDRDRALIQSITWGTAGAAVLILVAIATSSKTFGPAMSIAADCFAVTIPLLIAFGFAHMHQMDPAAPAPTAQECINLIGLIYGGQLLFAVGLGALLWDFNRGVSIAFIVACYLGGRAHKRFVVHRVPSNTVENVTAVVKPQGSNAANDPSGGATTAPNR